MNDKCHFDKSKHYCKALKVKACENCKFKKTEDEFLEDSEKAEKILATKGLRVCLHHVGNTLCVGVRKI